VIDTVLAKDKEFVQWRAEHGHSHVPHAASRARRSRSVSGHKTSAPMVGETAPVDSMRVS
jgi:hypothetical protein